MGLSVLVTGAFGNVGHGTVRHLLAAGHRVIATDLQTPKTERVAARFGKSVEVIWGNICDPALWPKLLAGTDAVIHLAAIIPPLSDLKPELATAVNITATAELVRQMQVSPTAKRLIFASSNAVAGFEQHLRTPPLTADDEPRPSDLYGRTKADCEQLIKASDLRWSILRITACPPLEISFGDAGNLDAMFSASEHARIEAVHNDDAALAFANAAQCDAAIGKVLYIGGGDNCRSTALVFYNRVFSAMGLGPIRAKALRPGPLHFFGDWVDTSESQRLLNFQRHNLDDIIVEMKTNAGYRRWFLKLLSPLITRMIERRSPYLRKS